jgi:hypothetical protein
MHLVKVESFFFFSKRETEEEEVYANNFASTMPSKLIVSYWRETFAVSENLRGNLLAF